MTDSRRLWTKQCHGLPNDSGLWLLQQPLSMLEAWTAPSCRFCLSAWLEDESQEYYHREGIQEYVCVFSEMVLTSRHWRPWKPSPCFSCMPQSVNSPCPEGTSSQLPKWLPARSSDLCVDEVLWEALQRLHWLLTNSEPAAVHILLQEIKRWRHKSSSHPQYPDPAWHLEGLLCLNADWRFTSSMVLTCRDVSEERQCPTNSETWRTSGCPSRCIITIPFWKQHQEQLPWLHRGWFSWKTKTPSDGQLNSMLGQTFAPGGAGQGLEGWL